MSSGEHFAALVGELLFIGAAWFIWHSGLLWIVVDYAMSVKF